ncbi:MAG: VOC family protein [Solirubrobacterales bacterium]
MPPRLRQAVLCARDLEVTVDRLREELGLGEPYRDPAVAYFGLANAVFAIGDTFLEVVSPVSEEEPGARTAARQLERSGADVCGYMAMLQVTDLAAARERARQMGVREVFAVELDDIEEVHLHPADMRGAIVALSVPDPAASWRWGGEGWADRSVPGRVAGITLSVADPEETRSRWEGIADAPLPACSFGPDTAEAPGITAITVEVGGEAKEIQPMRL